ncbi:MAG: glycosyltransferase family 39 protein [Patescibacteria group bacterium]
MQIIKKHWQKLILIFLLIIGLAVRLYKINSPLADWHSWRQADTASVARHFVDQGYQWLTPRFDDLSKIPSGLENPNGYRFVEFPIYNAVHAFTFQILDGRIAFETVGRLVSVFASLLAAVFLYLIVAQLLGTGPALLSTAFFLLLPFNIFYSRTVLPESSMMAAWLISSYLLLKDKVWASSVVAAIAILIKPYAVFFLAFDWLVYVLNHPQKKKIFRLGIGVILAGLPFLAWRGWMQQFPEGIPNNRWLLNGAGYRLKPVWWRWLFFERIGKLILGAWGPSLLIVGIISRLKNKKETLFYGWLLACFAYLVVFARGNVQHDYYQILIVPTLAVFLGKGGHFLLTAGKKDFHRFSPVLALVLTVFTLGFSWYGVREYYKINHPEIIEAGKRADQILPTEAKVVAPYEGDTAFLYQIHRPGWPYLTDFVPNMVKLGATHYVSVNFDQVTNELVASCQVLEQTPSWVIIDIRNCQ